MQRINSFPNRWLLLIACLLVAGVAGVEAGDQTGSAKKELVFLTWSDYIDPELVSEFEQKFKCTIKQAYYETDELKDDMLIETGGKGYDVVLSSGTRIIPYIKRDWVIPVTAAEIPNLKYIGAHWLEAQPKIAGYAVPYLWGTVGIAYREDLVPDKIRSWRQLYQPAEHFRKKIVMIKDSRETIGIALKALGYSFNSTDPQHYNEVQELLVKQRPFVREYSYISWEEDSLLVTGEVTMAMIYNGDALVLKEKLPQITYVVPEEGTALWVDFLVVMKASPNKKLAFEFINFLHEPRNAARNTSLLNFATPNMAAEKLLPPEIIGNPDIYPNADVMQKSEFFKELPPRIMRKCNEIFAKVTQ